MAQFDVHRNANLESRELFPFLLDLQSGHLDRLATRVVVPLALAAAVPQPLTRLNPSFVIGGIQVFMSTPELVGVPRAALGAVVGSLASRRRDIIAALDLLFTGF